MVLSVVILAASALSLMSFPIWVELIRSFDRYESVYPGVAGGIAVLSFVYYLGVSSYLFERSNVFVNCRIYVNRNYKAELTGSFLTALEVMFVLFSYVFGIEKYKGVVYSTSYLVFIFIRLVLVFILDEPLEEPVTHHFLDKKDKSDSDNTQDQSTR